MEPAEIIYQSLNDCEICYFMLWLL